mmetsp:Transcript_796/g.2145  ORF Transcript_796/g.2145 Transcript_796/m.2145 type:complete len:318 (-) Transcript_796:718-1671(-)
MSVKAGPLERADTAEPTRLSWLSFLPCVCSSPKLGGAHLGWCGCTTTYTLPLMPHFHTACTATSSSPPSARCVALTTLARPGFFSLPSVGLSDFFSLPRMAPLDAPSPGSNRSLTGLSASGSRRLMCLPLSASLGTPNTRPAGFSRCSVVLTILPAPSISSTPDTRSALHRLISSRRPPLACLMPVMAPGAPPPLLAVPPTCTVTVMTAARVLRWDEASCWASSSTGPCWSPGGLTPTRHDSPGCAWARLASVSSSSCSSSASVAAAAARSAGSLTARSPPEGPSASMMCEQLRPTRLLALNPNSSLGLLLTLTMLP